MMYEHAAPGQACQMHGNGEHLGSDARCEAMVRSGEILGRSLRGRRRLMGCYSINLYRVGWRSVLVSRGNGRIRKWEDS